MILFARPRVLWLAPPMYRFALIALAGCWTSSSPPPEEPKPKVKDIVQPVAITRADTGNCDENPDDCEAGEEGGVAGGVVGGVVGGAPPPPPPPPPPPAPPQNIPPTLLEVNRIAGDKNIVPNDVTKVAIMQSGKDKIVGSYKLCVAETGDVRSVTQLKSTGFADYDQKIQTEMRTNWRYRPYLINGNAVNVCTAVTFIYSQQAPTPPPPKP